MLNHSGKGGSTGRIVSLETRIPKDLPRLGRTFVCGESLLLHTPLRAPGSEMCYIPPGPIRRREVFTWHVHGMCEHLHLATRSWNLNGLGSAIYGKGQWLSVGSQSRGVYSLSWLPLILNLCVGGPYTVQGSTGLPSGHRPANEPDWGAKHALLHIPHPLTPPFTLRQRMRWKDEVSFSSVFTARIQSEEPWVWMKIWSVWAPSL